MTYRGRRVVAFIPYGRRRTVEILSAYLRRDHARGILDEVMLCMNTDEGQVGDRAYAELLEAESPGLFRRYRRPGDHGWEDDVCERPVPAIPDAWRDGALTPKQMNTGRFYVYMLEPETFYVRFDDDIVWVHPDAITAMIDAKLDRHPSAIAIFPLIWNNAVTTWFLQYNGHLPATWPAVGASAVDPIGWGNADFAEVLHGWLLDQLEAGASPPSVGDLELGLRQQFSVSCFAVEGREYVACGGILSYPEEEHWLTMHRTGELGRPNWVIGTAQVAHYTFFTQSRRINETDILERYRALAAEWQP